MHDSGESPLVSVVMPSCGRPDFLAHAVESVLRQSYHRLELIISDEPGAQSCREILGRITDPRCRIHLHSRKLGCWKNWTHAIQQAKGDFLVFLGDDDWLSENFIDCHLEALRRTPSATVSFCPVQEVHPDGSPLRTIETSLNPLEAIAGTRFLELVLIQKVFFGAALFRTIPAVDIWKETEADDLVADHGLLLRMAAVRQLTCTLAQGAQYNKTMHAHQLSGRFIEISRLHLELMNRVRKLAPARSLRKELDENATHVGILLARHHAATGDIQSARDILLGLLKVKPTLPTLWSQLLQSWILPDRLSSTARAQREIGTS